MFEINHLYVFDGIIILILMLTLFFATETNVSSAGKGLFIRKSLVCAISIIFMQVLVKTRYFHPRWFTQVLILIWWYGFALIKCFIMESGSIFENEIFIGTYGSAAFIVMQYYGEKHVKWHMYLLLTNLLKFILLLPPIVTVIHYLIYGAPITYEEMFAVYHTNYREAVEWLSTYIGTTKLVSIILLMIAVLFTVIKCEDMLTKYYVDCSEPRNKFLVLLVLILISYYPIVTLSKTDWVAHLFLAANYSKQISQYSEIIDNSYNIVELYNTKKIVDMPHTIIMVIGESACRDKMKVYNTDYPYDNTPWMSECFCKADFIFFKNAYGCHSLTQQVLENALTEKSQYNDKKLLESMNIIDIAKKKGYKTYWITNLSGSDTATTFSLIASRADYIFNSVDKYDDGMLNYLSEINPCDNNFIVFHGNGCHAAYNCRYPENRKVFDENNIEAEYSNSVKYVDDFLKDIYQYGVEHLNMQVMLYYSDHGENLLTGHGPSDHDFAKVRIPMFLYLGKDYQIQNKEKYSTLLKQETAFFTNDMIYNTVCGILSAESNYYNSTEDISNSSYNMQFNDLYTFGGKVKVNQDPFIKK